MNYRYNRKKTVPPPFLTFSQEEPIKQKASPIKSKNDVNPAYLIMLFLILDSF